MRKEKLKDIKEKEQAKAKLIHMLSREREHRRGKEIAIRATAAYKQGTRIEREEAERKMASMDRAELLQNAKDTHDNMVKKALSVDSHWKKSDTYSISTTRLVCIYIPDLVKITQCQPSGSIRTRGSCSTMTPPVPQMSLDTMLISCQIII